MIQQTNLEGESAEPYEGICCEACWFAKGEKCQCHCGGEHHGKGHESNPEMYEQIHLKRKYKSVGKDDHFYPSAQKYKQLITDPKCHCGFDLSNDVVWGYDHSDGWEVSETEHFQWLWIECPKCGYQMSLWKLGVPRDASVEDFK